MLYKYIYYNCILFKQKYLIDWLVQAGTFKRCHDLLSCMAFMFSRKRHPGVRSQSSRKSINIFFRRSFINILKDHRVKFYESPKAFISGLDKFLKMLELSGHRDWRGACVPGEVTRAGHCRFLCPCSPAESGTRWKECQVSRSLQTERNYLESMNSCLKPRISSQKVFETRPHFVGWEQAKGGKNYCNWFRDSLLVYFLHLAVS